MVQYSKNLCRHSTPCTTEVLHALRTRTDFEDVVLDTLPIDAKSAEVDRHRCGHRSSGRLAALALQNLVLFLIEYSQNTYIVRGENNFWMIVYFLTFGSDTSSRMENFCIFSNFVRKSEQEGLWRSPKKSQNRLGVYNPKWHF